MLGYYTYDDMSEYRSLQCLYRIKILEITSFLNIINGLRHLYLIIVNNLPNLDKAIKADKRIIRYSPNGSCFDTFIPFPPKRHLHTLTYQGPQSRAISNLICDVFTNKLNLAIIFIILIR